MTPLFWTLLSVVLPLAGAYLLNQHMKWSRDERDEQERKQKFLDDLDPLHNSRRPR